MLNSVTELANKGSKWRFNPPSAPHHGGIWERLVRSFKRLLYTILGTRRLTDEALNTTFCLVEYALNSRPLTPVSADPSNLGAITPNHFLLGNQAFGIPTIIGVDEFHHRKRYARAQSYANVIWARWIKEYVPALNRRAKLQTPAENHLKAGDLVGSLKKATLGATIQLLGLNNSVTAPTASPAPPSYTRLPDRSYAHSLSLYRSSQHFLPGRRMLPSKLNEQRYLEREMNNPFAAPFKQREKKDYVIS